jgi:antitoxin YefM
LTERWWILEPEKAVVVTRRGVPVLAILNAELFETIMETLEIMGDPEQMKALQKGIKEMKEGKTIPWDEARRRLA